MRRSLVAVVLILTLATILLDLTGLPAEPRRPDRPPHHLSQGFRNLSPEYFYSLGYRARGLLRRAMTPDPPRGLRLEVLPNNGGELRANGTAPTLTWVGHSTFLIQLAGLNILTDPHWGDRASPVRFAGPRRLVAPGLRFEDLPTIDVVVISHDHYDHLDAGTVERIARAHPGALFLVPLGIKAWLADLGIHHVEELDWWESRDVHGVTFTCTPAQHSSGRGLNDQNLRLWSSWVLATPAKRLFFAGDTGYDRGLADIGRRRGPFDVTLLPIGGYGGHDGRHPNHLSPEEAVQLFEDLDARLLVPMHWGTFELNREPFREPPTRLLAEALRRGLEERIGLLNPGQSIHW